MNVINLTESLSCDILHNSKEVDFAATKVNEKTYIQVTESMDAMEARQRKLAPLKKIPDNYEKQVICINPGL